MPRRASTAALPSRRGCGQIRRNRTLAQGIRRCRHGVPTESLAPCQTRPQDRSRWLRPTRTSSPASGCPPSTGRTDPVVDPATGRAVRRGGGQRRRRRRRRGGRGRRGLRRVVVVDAGGAQHRAPEAGVGHRGQRGRTGRDGVPRRGQADRGRARGDRVPRRQPPLLRRGRPAPRRPGRGRVHEGLHVDAPARPARRRRVDRAVELPADDGGVEDRARAGRRQHGGAEAVGGHAADARCGWRRSPARCSRRACSTSSPATATPAPHSCAIRRWRWCRSPARSPPARR